VAKLAESIEAHYVSMEATLGKARLLQLYALLDEVIAMPLPAEDAPSQTAKRAKA
jgi:hypothetical protein